jgi:hypothetical protein
MTTTAKLLAERNHTLMSVRQSIDLDMSTYI